MLDFQQCTAAETYINQTLYVYDFLLRQTDLSPRNPGINRALSAFIRETMKPRRDEETTAILNAPRIKAVVPHLRRLLGHAEYQMECFCARAMVGNEPDAPPGYVSYSNFIYRENYEALVASELRAMKWHLKQPPLKPDRESVVFVGAGPLPISAIMFHHCTGLPVTCIDNDEKACVLGKKLVRHLAATEPGCKGLDRNIHYIHADGARHDYITHPIVFIASLVDHKDTVVSRIVKTSHTVATTVVRSAEGLSTLLYQPEDCKPGQEEYNFYLAGQSAPSSLAINTSLVYKFPPGKNWARNKIGWEGQADDLNVLKPRPYRMRTRPYDTSI